MGTILFTAFFTDKGIPKTGLTPTMRVRKLSDNSLVLTDVSMSEVGDGFYKYSWASYDEGEDYVIRCDGGSSLANHERYVYGSSEDFNITKTLETKFPSNYIMGSGVATNMNDEIDGIKAQTDLIQFDIGNNVEVNVQDKGVLNDISTTEVNTEVDAALADIRLDELLDSAMSGNPTPDSTFDKIMNKDALQTFDRSTDSLEQLSLSISVVDANVDFIKLKTDNLPSDPASESNVDDVQTDVTAIKAQTDKLQFDVSNNVEANVQDKGILNDPSASDIDTQLSGTHGAGSWETGTPSTPTDIADAVWDEDLSGHVTAGSAGKSLQDTEILVDDNNDRLQSIQQDPVIEFDLATPTGDINVYSWPENPIQFRVIFYDSTGRNTLDLSNVSNPGIFTISVNRANGDNYSFFSAATAAIYNGNLSMYHEFDFDRDNFLPGDIMLFAFSNIQLTVNGRSIKIPDIIRIVNLTGGDHIAQGNILGGSTSSVLLTNLSYIPDGYLDGAIITAVNMNGGVGGKHAPVNRRIVSFQQTNGQITLDADLPFTPELNDYVLVRTEYATNMNVNISPIINFPAALDMKAFGTQTYRFKVELFDSLGSQDLEVADVTNSPLYVINRLRSGVNVQIDNGACTIAASGGRVEVYFDKDFSDLDILPGDTINVIISSIEVEKTGKEMHIPPSEGLIPVIGTEVSAQGLIQPGSTNTSILTDIDADDNVFNGMSCLVEFIPVGDTPIRWVARNIKTYTKSTKTFVLDEELPWVPGLDARFVIIARKSSFGDKDVSDNVLRILGLTHENAWVTHTHDGQGNHISSEFEIYDTKANAETHDGVTGLIAKYSLTVTYNAGLPQDHLMVKE